MIIKKTFADDDGVVRTVQWAVDVVDEIEPDPIPPVRDLQAMPGDQSIAVTWEPEHAS